MSSKDEKRTDKQILSLVKEDLQYFSIFYEKYFDDIYKYCYVKMNYKKSQTEDIVSEVFLRAVENIQDVELEEDNQTILPWLYTIARNLIYDTWRKKKGKNKIRLDNEDLEKDHADFFQSRSSSKDIDLEIDKNIKLKSVKKELKHLSEKTAEIIYLKINNEMTFKEIANQLNMSESAVKMRYYRGLEKVTKNIKKQL